MTGERVAGALVMGTTPSRSRVQMRLTVAAIHVNRGHMILVICGRSELAELEEVEAENLDLSQHTGPR